MMRTRRKEGGEAIAGAMLYDRPNEAKEWTGYRKGEIRIQPCLSVSFLSFLTQCWRWKQGGLDVAFFVTFRCGTFRHGTWMLYKGLIDVVYFLFQERATVASGGGGV